MFKGLGNLGNIASMVGSLQKMPEKLKELNERMKREDVTASSGCGTVHVSMNGVGHVQAVKIEGDLQGHQLEQRSWRRPMRPVRPPRRSMPRRFIRWPSISISTCPASTGC